MATSEAYHLPDSEAARLPTFALVDHGLTSAGGHNLTYCRRVLGAAATQGLRVVAGVGCTGASYDVHAPSLALFPRDLWKNNPAEGRQWNILAALAALQRMGERLSHVQSDSAADGRFVAEPDRARGAAGPRHPGALARGLLQDAAILLTRSTNGRRFSRELADFISQAQLDAGDVVYIPTVLATELRGLEHLLAHSEIARRLRWRLMLRYAPKARSVKAAMAASGSRLHRRKDVDVGFSSDTEQLCRMYEGLCDAPFTLLPIPVTPDIPHVQEAEGSLVIGYFGDARDEKGFNLLPSIIHQVREGSTDRLSIRFVVQMNLNTLEGDPRTRAARLDLLRFGSGDLQLVEGPLAPDVYQSLLRTADIIILPYEPSAYAERSSGVLMEALMAGTPCVVTGGGWMAAMIEAAEVSNPAGAVVPADAGAIAEAVLRIAADWSRYARGARSLREKLRPRFDPAELVRLVTQEKWAKEHASDPSHDPRSRRSDAIPNLRCDNGDVDSV